MASTAHEAAVHGGLSEAEAARRLAADGPNALPAASRPGLLKLAWDSAREPMFLLLLGAAALYLTLGELHEGLFLLATVALTVGLSLYQQGKTERALDALRELGSPRALVVRDGHSRHLDSRALVRGDLIVVAEGDRVPADARLLAGHALRVDESLLTGESLALDKAAGADGEAGACLFSGTLVVAGHATAIVTATGAHSRIGAIGASLRQLAPEASPLRRQTRRLTVMFAVLGLALSVTLVLLHGLRGGAWLQGVLAGIALAMAMVPEEFAVVLVVFPALGAWRLARERVLTRRLAAIETLGATSVLCVDKTGTLTENRMRVARLHAAGQTVAPGAALGPAVRELLEYALLASAATPFDPMEQALVRLARRELAGSDQLHPHWRLVREEAPRPALRAMLQAWRAPGSEACTVAAKGAPEAIAAMCRLDARGTAALLATADDMARDGLRVLAVARAGWDGAQWPPHPARLGFTLLGLVALADPLRAGIPDAVRALRAAGIRVVMITGDYPSTAQAIARQAGLAEGALLTGDALAAMKARELRACIGEVTVCARIAPEQKLRIVQALKAGGAIVGMTGDGVNDAPALRAAHVGIAMGQRGTDVAREAAVLVLLDDRFDAIVAAVRAGRRIFAGMRRAVGYLVSVHACIAGMALLPVLFGWPVLLLPMHIVFLELMIDPACTLAFENDAPDPDSMRKPPRRPGAPLIGAAGLLRAGLHGALALAHVIAAWLWAWAVLAPDAARAFAFTALVGANLALMFAHATRRRPNRVRWMIAAGALAALLAVIYVPALAAVFHFAPLSAAQLVWAGAIGLSLALWPALLGLAQRLRR
ncbi:cation-translocating P-type ATPase [Massilia sp. CCM 9210]|uniref:cation-translocating P-type ATPase n=1 Tax=Massilia scottii TaxID=3057166 RepID=UPI002796BE7E|nr:cation-translocating P-type ATPase [Massilia sp. CCM 9210]MDQ1813007.1 cation-translocating P-type ATPase [Massilia sp. CCM 9210]